MKKSLIGMIMLLLMVAIFGSSNVLAKSDKVAVYAVHQQLDDFAILCVKGFEKAVQETPGWRFEWTNANFDPALQISQVEGFIAKDVDFLCILPMEEEGMAPTVLRANRAGIPVIAMGMDPVQAGGQLTLDLLGDVESDHYQGGQQAAEALVKEMGTEGHIAIITIGFEMRPVAKRVEGFKDFIAQYPDIKIVAEQRAVNTEEAMAVAENIYQAHPDLDGAFGSYANAILGLAQAAKNQKRTDLTLVGIDGDREICKLIHEGWIAASSTQDPHQIGYLAAKMGMDFVEDIGNPGHRVIPQQLIDRDNYENMFEWMYGVPLKEYIGQ